MSGAPDRERLHLLGIRHHGPGSAALLRQALDALDPACVLIEGPPEGDVLIAYVNASGMKPPVAMLLYAAENPNTAIFMPFAEFSPEWQAMCWALERNRPVRFMDWPAAVSLALKENTDPEPVQPEQQESKSDALDLLASAAGFDDGETFWNSLIEQHGWQQGEHALDVFRSIETAMTEARAHEQSLALAGRNQLRDLQREAFMRTQIRAALKQHDRPVAVVCGAWHLSALRSPGVAGEDRAIIKDLSRIKVEATWVPWTDNRLSTRSGYAAGVISPGWYRHLWFLYRRVDVPGASAFAAMWQARTANLLRAEGYGATTATAIDATQLALTLAALRGLPMPGLEEMRDASLATLCHGNPVPLALVERKLYIGERVGEIGEDVPQMPLARDLASWQRKTRLKPGDEDVEVRVDLRSEAGLLKSTLLHRLNLIHVPWGTLLDAQAGRGTFREVWTVRWRPELSVALAEALIYGVTIEQAAANAAIERAREIQSVRALAELVQAVLIADLPQAATQCIALLQAAAVSDSDITELMLAVDPLARVLRYGSARELPEAELRALIVSLAAEVNAGTRIGSRSLDDDTALARVRAMESYDAALTLLGDAALIDTWTRELQAIVADEQVAPLVAGLSLRRLHERSAYAQDRVAAEFEFHTTHHSPQQAGRFLEGFVRGGSEVLLQDDSLLRLLDTWLCALTPQGFIESLPLLRRSLSDFDATARRRLLEKLRHDPQHPHLAEHAANADEVPQFASALPLLYEILGLRGLL